MKLFVFCGVCIFCNLILQGVTVEKIADEDSRNYWQPQTIIRQMAIRSNITNRYARTMVASYVNNPKLESHETTFTVVLPQKAFISDFVIKVGDKDYVANVAGKKEAKSTYMKALKEGKTAGHVAVRDTNTFMISVNVEPLSEIEFFLTYEELLERKKNQYELVINIFPGQIVDDLSVEVFINETRPLDFVKTPQIRSGKKIETRYKRGLKPSVRIVTNGETSMVNFTATPAQQKMFATELGTNESQGLAGQFVVVYDVARDLYAGELLLQDNFFIHYLAPDDIDPLFKHIVFVLDTSGSMGERTKRISKNDPTPTKLEQLKDAMQGILNNLQPNDLFTIIEFTHKSCIVDLNKINKKKCVNIRDYRNPFGSLNMRDFPPPFITNNVEVAKTIVENFASKGGTNIIAALETALAAIKFSLIQNGVNKNIQPIIMFLTDGRPYSGIVKTDEIIRIITEINQKNQKIPIYTLSFGNQADQNFLRKLSIKNGGFLRHILAESDASLQLQDFYKDISVPLLKNIEFMYNNNVVNVSRTRFPILFKGSEIAVCGYYNGTGDPANMVTVKAMGSEGNMTLQPEEVEIPTVSLERLCAFLTVQQKLEENRIFQNPDSAKSAFDLAMKYSFVTDLTSLIVVKPEPSRVIENIYEIADIDFRFGDEDSSQTNMGVYHVGDEDQSTDEEVIADLKESLPWLINALDGNNALTVNGTTYLLGVDNRTSSNETCQSTPLPEVETGICKLLIDCSDVWSNLSTHSDFLRYFCVVDNIYAGVCSP